MEAIIAEPDRFGGAGHILALDDADSVLEAVRRSRLYRRHRKRHAPRMKGEEDERLLTIELLVRILCALDLQTLDLTDTRTAKVVRAALSENVGKLRPSEPAHTLAAYVMRAKPHLNGSYRLYEDVRRVLMMHPL